MNAFLNHSSDYKKDGATSVSVPATTRKTIDYKRKRSGGLAPRFIFECAIKLNMKPLTSATAAIIYHRFFREVENESYDEYVRLIRYNAFEYGFLMPTKLLRNVYFSPKQLIASASMYLAGKLKDDMVKIRDVINVTHNTLNRGKFD